MIFDDDDDEYGFYSDLTSQNGQPLHKVIKPWERLGITPSEYAILLKRAEQEIANSAYDKHVIRRFEKEPPFVFAGLGCLFWIAIAAIGLFFGALLAK